MAERRMFAKTIIDSDAFIDMPVTARLLYYDLAMRADDDGFVNSPKKIMRMVGASQDDLSILIMRKFIIPFDNGIVVIKHWKIHNYIRKDTYNETPYTDQKAMLETDENKAYRLKKTDIVTGYIQAVDEPSTQVRLGKDRLGKDNNNIPPQPPKLEKEHINGAEFVTMTNDEYEKLIATYGKEFTDKCVEVLDNYKGSSGRKYKSDYRAILSWVANKVNETKQKEKKTNAYVNETQSEYNDLDRFYN
jgi:hypothetical protein